MCPENFYYPTVLASPKQIRSDSDVKSEEVLDFTQYCLDERVILKRKKFPPFFTKHRSWEIYLKKQEYLRNQDKVRRHMFAEYGEVRSFYTDEYPECRAMKLISKRKKEETDVEET